MTSRRFTTVAVAAPRDHLRIPVPFDPDDVWGTHTRHHVGGTVNGIRIRGVVAPGGDGFEFTLGPAWLRDCGVAAGDTVVVELAPEGPQFGDLPEDLAAAFAANPDAAAFFSGLAQFYRRAYLRWIDATSRRPDLRAERIAETMRLLEAGRKERPKPATGKP